MSRILLISLLACPMALPAQRLWLDPAPDASLEVAAAVGVFGEGSAAFPTGTFAIRGRFPAGDGLTTTVELPLAVAKLSDGPSGMAIGNPWLGLEVPTADNLVLEFGVRLAAWSPKTRETALPWAFGPALDFDRWEAWFTQTSSLRFGAQIGRLPESGPFFIAKIGGAVIHNSGGADLLANYAGRAGIVSQSGTLSLAVIGHGFVTNAEGSFGDRTVHQVELRAVLGSGRLRPEVAIRKYVGERGFDVVKAILLVGLTVAQ